MLCCRPIVCMGDMHCTLMSPTSGWAQSYALDVFGDLHSLQVLHYREIGAHISVAVKVPGFVSPHGQRLIEVAAISSPDAEVLAMGKLLQIYRSQRVVLDSGSALHVDSIWVAELNLLHLFLIYLRMHLGHNARALLDIDRVLTSEVGIDDLDAEELCEAMCQVISFKKNLQQELAEEIAATWNTFSAAAHANLRLGNALDE